MTQLSSLTGSRLQQMTLGAGVIGAGLTLLGFVIAQGAFFPAYLAAFTFWWSVSLGCMAVLMMTHITGGGWAHATHGLLRAGTRTIPLILLLSLPLLLGLHDLYEWTHADFGAESEILQHKTQYLNQPFFLGRMAVYFVIWLGLSLLLTREHDTPPRGLSAFGLILYVMTVTLASVDLVMSLEPHWFSSIYGLLFVGMQVLSSIGLIAALLIYLGDSLPLSTQALQDLGNILLGALMVWAYLSLIQFVVIWSGNLPEEVVYYIERVSHGWQWVTIGLFLFSFVVPFALLIASPIKNDRRRLAQVGLLIVVTQWIHMIWLIKPSLGLALHWLDIAAPLGVGGIWLTVFLWLLHRQNGTVPAQTHSTERKDA